MSRIAAAAGPTRVTDFAPLTAVDHECRGNLRPTTTRRQRGYHLQSSLRLNLQILLHLMIGTDRRLILTF